MGFHRHEAFRIGGIVADLVGGRQLLKCGVLAKRDEQGVGLDRQFVRTCLCKMRFKCVDADGAIDASYLKCPWLVQGMLPLVATSEAAKQPTPARLRRRSRRSRAGKSWDRSVAK